MIPEFDAFEYTDYLRRRWRVLVGACAVALLLSLGVSLLLPKRYTATATLIIEPPGGNDARLATAVSPMYLESLKTYEHFAGNDSLFARAAERFHLLNRQGSPSIETLKRRVLRVSKLKDTKILEISVTLANAKLAQQVTQYIAEGTVSTNRSEGLAADQEFVDQAQKQADDARAHLEELQERWNKLSAAQPIESLQSEIDTDIDLRGKVQQQLMDAQSEAVDYEQQIQSGGEFAQEQLQAARARAALLEKQTQLLERTIQEKTNTLANRNGPRTALQSELKVAQTSYEAASNRLRDYQAAVGTHAEQLRIVDPGIVPERPSSPNVFLNVIAAALLAVIASLVYLSFAFVFRRRPVALETPITRGLRA